MREVVKWNRDYTTNEVITEKVLKENNGLKGQAKILVYGEDGELKNETFTENIIISDVNEGEWYRSLFSTIANGGTSANGGTPQANQFHTMILGTNSRDENKDILEATVGNIVGWCPKTDNSPGSDATRGVYNPTESFVKWEKGYLHYHLVYDFGTSQGNGTFQSIWWGKQNYNNVKIAPITIRWGRPIGGARGRLDKSTPIRTLVGGQYCRYDTSDSKYKRIINGEMYVQGATALELSKKDSEHYSRAIELPLAHQELPNSGGKYIKVSNYSQVGGSSSTLVLKFDLELRDKDNAIISNSSLNISNFTNITDFHKRHSYTGQSITLERVFDVQENGDVYMIFRSNSNSSSYKIFPVYISNDDIINDDTSNRVSNIVYLGVYNIFNQQWVVEPSLRNVESMRVSASSSLCDIYGRIDTKDTTTSYYYRWNEMYPILIVKPHPTLPYRWNVTSPHIQEIQPKSQRTQGDNFATAHIHGTNYIMTLAQSDSTSTSEYYYPGDMILQHGYTAHTKLPNAVVKTSADTMKIQYDYYIQVPKIVSTDGDFLTFPTVE